ncbi:MAG TPA: hypothetical protein VE961_26970 [Pyrinomonadaceae bacterium]|nr:hypothetical protein [Pyrinomonadaceae bacterium]
MQAGSLDVFPIWTLIPITLVIGAFSVEAGYRVAIWRKRRAKEHHSEAPTAPIVGATLGLLAFLVAFTFGSAASRFEERRQAVLAESNAINAAYLRAQMIPDPMSGNARNLLREYVDVRLTTTQTGQIAQGIAKSEELHKRMWGEAVAASQKERSPMTSLFMSSLNDVFALHEKRVTAAVYNRIPPMIWIGLYMLLVFAMLVVGYYEGMNGTRHTLAVYGMVFAFSLVFAIIADLDRPGRGLLEVNQQSMVDLQKSMRDTP